MQSDRDSREPILEPVSEPPVGQPGEGAKKRELRLVEGAQSKDAPADARDEAARPPLGGAVLDWSELMAHAQDGDGKAYARLLGDIAPYLRSLAAARLDRATDVEDAVQDVLLTIHRLRHTYDPKRPFGPWLVTIAKRRIVDRFRQASRWKSRETPLMPVHETFSADQANKYEESADREVLRKAVDGLPPGQRDAIRLLKLEEMSLKEASAATGMSISALKVATHRAMKNLRNIILDGNN